MEINNGFKKEEFMIMLAKQGDIFWAVFSNAEKELTKYKNLVANLKKLISEV